MWAGTAGIKANDEIEFSNDHATMGGKYVYVWMCVMPKYDKEVA